MAGELDAGPSVKDPFRTIRFSGNPGHIFHGFGNIEVNALQPRVFATTESLPYLEQEVADLGQALLPNLLGLSPSGPLQQQIEPAVPKILEGLTL